MPVDFTSYNTFTFNSRLWGSRPRKLAAFSAENEKEWAEKLAEELKRDFGFCLSTSLGIFRSAKDIGKLSEGVEPCKNSRRRREQRRQDGG
jgi:SPX domain protein involved in polyphosphate accumulation